MRRGSFVQTVTDRKKVNLRKFPTRNYKNCQIYRSIFCIDTHIIDQEMHADYIRLFICHSILGGGWIYRTLKKKKKFTSKSQGSSGHHGCLLGQIICWHKKYDH